MSPKILGFLTVGMVIPVMVRFSVMPCSCLSGVKSVAVDLSGFDIKSLFFVQLRYLEDKVEGVAQLYESLSVRPKGSYHQRRPVMIHP